MKTSPKRRPAATGALLAGAISFVMALGGAAARVDAKDSPIRHINSERLQDTLERLSEFGRNPAGGVTRLGFSQAELDARAYVMDLMKQAGLEVRVDPAGNIFGRRAGTGKLPALLFGSPGRCPYSPWRIGCGDRVAYRAGPQPV